MSLVGNNFFHAVVQGRALLPGAISSATVEGDTISEPWKTGRQITFLACFGNIAASSAMTLKVQGLLRSDGTTWEDVQVASTDLDFATAKIVDGGAADGATLIGTLDLNVFDGETYEAIRIEAVESGGGSVPVSVHYVISDLLRHPSGETDEMFDTQRNAPSA